MAIDTAAPSRRTREARISRLLERPTGSVDDAAPAVRWTSGRISTTRLRHRLLSYLLHHRGRPLRSRAVVPVWCELAWRA